MSLKTYLNFGFLYLHSKTNLDFFLPRKVHPLRASIRLTENCNSKCITCNYWEKKWEDKISADNAINIIHDLKQLGVERLRFTGGETFLRRDFFEIINAINPGDFKKITVATNGLFLKRCAEKINQSSITDLGVSIDGMPETNDKIRGIKGHFHIVFEGIKRANKRVTIMTTLNQSNAYELEDLLNVCEDHDALWDFNLLDNRLFFLKGKGVEDIWPDENAVNHIMGVIRRNMHRPVLKRINHLQIGYAERYLKKMPIKEPRCYLGYTDIDIDSAGDLWSGCYVLPPIGNILKDNLEDLLKSETYISRLDHMLRRQCPGCTCGYEINVSIEQLPKKACAFFIMQKKK